MPRLRQPVAMKKNEPFDSEKAAQLLEEQNKKEEENQPEPQLEAVSDDRPPKEPEKPPVEEPKQDDAALALKKQLDQIRESEVLIARLQQERDETARKLREQELERAKLERKTVQSQYESVGIALKAAKEKVEFAKRDIRAASDAGDKEAELAAFERLAEAKAEIMTLEPGRDELKDKRRAEKKKVRELRDQVQQPQPQAQSQQAAPHVTEWTKAHSEYFDGGLKQKKLYAAYYQAASEGLEEYSPAMLERMDQILGPKTPPEPAKKAPIVSAPVSREVPSGGSGRRSTEQVTLTAEEREFAKISNITEAEYARQKQRLLEAKANGQYTGGQ